MNIPSRADIDIYGSPEEENACKHFLGKDMSEAELLFREESTLYQEDLMWMGPVAFRYYVKAAIHYIQSDEASCDSDMIHAFAGILEFHLHAKPYELISIAGELLSTCDYIIQNNDRYDLTPEIYGNVRSRFAVLSGSFKRLISANKKQ